MAEVSRKIDAKVEVVEKRVDALEKEIQQINEREARREEVKPFDPT